MRFTLIPPGAWLPHDAVRSGFTSQRHWRFTDEYVSLRSEGLGAEEWTEPMASYRGVLRSYEFLGKSGMRFKLTLVHGADEKRNVDVFEWDALLARNRVGTSWWLEQKRYARLLGLPALVKGDEGFIERRPEDLGKSVRQLVREGALPVQFDPTAPPPGRGLVIRSDPPALGISTKPGLAGWLAVAIGATVIILAAVVVAATLKQPFAPAPVIIAVGLVFSILVAGLCASGLVCAELSVSPEEVGWRWSVAGTFHPGTRDKRVRAERVEEVAVTDYGVQVMTDEQMLEFGYALTKGEKRWVRDCIIAVISLPADG